ncbi:MAG: SPOR domain-containing protein [Thermoanaerobaculia bacterium]
MADPAKKSYYQVSFTGAQALVGLVGILAALALAFFLGAKAGFEKSAPAASAPSVVPPPESESSVSAPAAPTSTTIEAPPPVKRLPTPSSSPLVPAPDRAAASSAPEEAPVFEDREAGVGEDQAPSRTEIAGATAGAALRPSSAASPKNPESPKNPKSRNSPAPKPAASRGENSSPAPSKAAAGFYVQILSTTSKSEAARWKDRLSAKKYKPALSAVDSSRGRMYRVRLGPYADREQAKKLAAKISAEFHLRAAAWVAPAR